MSRSRLTDVHWPSQLKTRCMSAMRENSYKSPDAECSRPATVFSGNCGAVYGAVVARLPLHPSSAGPSRSGPARVVG